MAVEVTITDVRILGGYAVVPTALTLRGIRNDAERLSASVEAVAALHRLIASINTVADDSAIKLRDRGTKWDSIARRAGVSVTTIIKRLDARRALLSGDRDTEKHRLIALKRTA